MSNVLYPGPPIFLVGGSVRDMLSGVPSKDRDFCVPCTWDELKAVVARLGFEILVEKPEFLTLRVRGTGREVMDFACCRAEAEYDGRRPQDVQCATLATDLARRDFTVNAMALLVHPLYLTPWPQSEIPAGYLQGAKIGPLRVKFVGHNDQPVVLFDPHDGWGDLKAKSLIFVGKPEDRLAEDGLRWLRAMRFHLVKGFDLTPATYKALENAGRDLMDKVSTDRVRDELEKCFAHDTWATVLFLTRMPRLWMKQGLWFKPTTEKRPGYKTSGKK